MTIAGIAIGVAALVASVGISESTGAQVVTRFYQAQAAFLTVAGAGDAPLVLSEESLRDVYAYPVVESVARVTTYQDGVLIRSRAPGIGSAVTEFTTEVVGMQPEAFTVIGAQFSVGRPYDTGHQTRSSRVVVLGRGLASRLGIYLVMGQPVVTIDGREFLVQGVIDNVNVFPQVLDSAMMPISTAFSTLGLPNNATIILRSTPSATYGLAARLPLLLNPAAPEALDVAVPPPPPDVAAAVSSDLNALTLVLTGVGTLVAAVSVAAIMTINVVERTSEIGLRRALGASRFQIGLQFIGESAAIGAAGGLAGAATGILIVLIVARQNDWLAVLSPHIPFLALALGVGTGLIAGTYPAMRAARTAPAVSLRR